MVARDDEAYSDPVTRPQLGMSSDEYHQRFSDTSYDVCFRRRLADVVYRFFRGLAEAVTLHACPKPQPPLVSPLLRKSARGQRCTVRWADGCTDEEGAVVLAHVRSARWSGVGQKPPDWMACFGCSACNAAMESGNRPPESVLLRAVFETWDIWFRDGLIKIGK